MTDHTDKLYLAALKHSLEPIVELDAGQILSFEVRSFSGDRAAHGHADPEDVGLSRCWRGSWSFFRSCTSKTLGSIPPCSSMWSPFCSNIGCHGRTLPPLFSNSR